jgi:hypothetical protein
VEITDHRSLSIKAPRVERLTHGGYLASLSAAAIFAAALLSSYSNPLLKAGATGAVIDAIYVSTAAVMAGLSAMFELAERLRGRTSIPLSLAFVIGLCIAGIALFVLPLQRPLPVIVALLLGIRALFILRRSNWQNGLCPLLGGAVMGYWAFLLSFVDGYKTPWVGEAALLGRVHVDLLFHSGIVNMLRNYDVGSLGVDGIPAFPYHFGSHRIVAMLAPLLKVEPLSFYSIIFPLIFSPFFIAAMLFFATAFHDYLRKSTTLKKNIDLKQGNWFWVTLTILFIGMIPAYTQRQLGQFYNVFHSESFSAAMLFAYLPCILFFEGIADRVPRPLSLGWLILGAMCLVELCTLKISVAFVLAGAAGYLLLRVAMSWSNRVYGVVAIAGPLIYGLWLTRADSNSQTGPTLVQMIKPFAFIREVIPENLRFDSFFTFFGPFIIFIILRLALQRTSFRHGFSLREFKDYKLIDMEILVVLLLVSIAPGLILTVPQGATNFFSEVSYWFVIPMLSVVLSMHLQSRRTADRVCKWLCRKPSQN